MPPADPEAARQLVADPEFQALEPTLQLSTFRSFLAQGDPEFAALNSFQQESTARTIFEGLQPSTLERVGDVAEFIPVVGGAVRGSRAFDRGEELRPLTSLLVAGFQPETAFQQGLAEAGRELAEIVVTGGAAAAARPLLARTAARIVGGEAASTLLPKALGQTRTAAGTFVTGSQAAEAIALPSVRQAVRTRRLTNALTELTAGELFGLTQATERALTGGEAEPFADFVATPIGVATLGMAVLGVQNFTRRFGQRQAQEVFEALTQLDPQRAARVQEVTNDAGKVVEAVRRTLGSGATRDDAAELVLDAAQGPLADDAAGEIIKRTLRTEPEILETELGLQLLRTQRRRIAQPAIQETADGPVRVQLDVLEEDQALPFTIGQAGGRTLDRELAEEELEALAGAVANQRVIVEAAQGPADALRKAGLVREAAEPEPQTPFASALAPEPEPEPSLGALAPLSPEDQQLADAATALRREALLPNAGTLDDVRGTPQYIQAFREAQNDLAGGERVPSPDELDASALARLGLTETPEGAIQAVPDDAVQAQVLARSATVNEAPAPGSPIRVVGPGGQPIEGRVTGQSGAGRVRIELPDGNEIVARPTALGADFPPELLSFPATPSVQQLPRAITEDLRAISLGNAIEINGRSFHIMGNDGTSVILRPFDGNESAVVPLRGVAGLVANGQARVRRSIVGESITELEDDSFQLLNERRTLARTPEGQQALAQEEQRVIGALRQLDDDFLQDRPSATVSAGEEVPAQQRTRKFSEFLEDADGRKRGRSELVRGCPPKQ